MSTETMHAIQARGLIKRFGTFEAVAGIDLEVKQGTIFAILGPNGAGKTTLMRMLATLERPDDGTATIVGHNVITAPDQVRASIAMTGQFASLDEDLTGRENLMFLARLWGFSWRAARHRADELFAAFELSDAQHRQVKDYSGGMRRRLDIAASLVVTPSVLFLDEPTTGLDPTARQRVWRMIRGLAESGVTVLLSTQYLEEADQLADQIVVIDRGRKIAEGTSRELKAATGSGFLHVTLSDSDQIDTAVSVLSECLCNPVQRNAEGQRLSVMVSAPADATNALAALISSDVALEDFALGSPSLEEVFFALTKDDVQPRGVAK